MLRAALSFVLLCCVPAFAADNFAGTYTARNSQGNVVTLTLKQDAQGKVSGTLAGQGLTFEVEGEVRPEGLIGTLTGDSGMLFLISRLRGAELDVLLAEPDPSGQPNMQATRQFVMTRGAAKKPAAAKDQ